ncbi:MAG TPA: glycosyltransferase family 39 protein [Bacillota bacterium]|nr:glycosyltransferase family 39 protein [Bacillota bacterium]
MRSVKTLVYAALILGIALYLRLRFIIYAPFEFKIDAWSMYNYALNVMNGEYYGHSFGEHWSRYAYWPPLYIFLSGFVYRFFGTAQDFIVMRVIQAGFSAVSCLLCFITAREALCNYSDLHEEAGLTAGVLMALDTRMVAYTNHLYVETVFITIYLAAVYFSLRYFKDEMSLKLCCPNGSVQVKHLVLFSIFLGLGNLTRPVLLLLPAVLLISGLFFIAARRFNICRGIKVLAADGALSLLIMLAVLSPWILRNYAVTGRLILIDTNGPINFYIAHNPHSNGTWTDVKKSRSDMLRLYETGYKEGLVYISNNISREIDLLNVKQRLFLYHGDYHISEAEVYLSRTYKLPLYGSLIKMGIVGKDILENPYRLPQMSFEFLWKSALLLLVLFILRLMAARSLYLLFCEPAWIIGNFLYMNLIILIFYYAPRYRITAEPFLCILIGILLAGIFTSYKNNAT